MAYVDVPQKGKEAMVFLLQSAMRNKQGKDRGLQEKERGRENKRFINIRHYIIIIRHYMIKEKIKRFINKKLLFLK